MKKQLVVSGLNFGSEFFTTLYKKVVKLGGTEEQIFDAMKTESPLIDKWAEDIVNLFTKVKKLSLQSLSDLITSLKLDWVNENITEANFPAQPEDLIETEKEFKEFQFGKTMFYKNIIAEMNKENFRPATTREQLKWALKNWNGESIIVALGQTWLNADDFRFVSVFRLNDSKRKLDLNWFDDVWFDHYHFLGVRK